MLNRRKNGNASKRAVCLSGMVNRNGVFAVGEETRNQSRKSSVMRFCISIQDNVCVRDVKVIEHNLDSCLQRELHGQLLSRSVNLD